MHPCNKKEVDLDKREPRRYINSHHGCQCQKAVSLVTWKKKKKGIVDCVHGLRGWGWWTVSHDVFWWYHLVEFLHLNKKLL